jgi:hypothetical protein
MKRDPAMGEPRKRLTRMRYQSGPMGFLADQIMKELQRAGYPPREFNLYRPPAQQEIYRRRGNSKAKPFSSAHQFYAASDIIHEKWAWFAADEAPDGAQFWDRLWDCVEVVAEKYKVEFSERLSWDPAHVQLDNWREFREVVGHKEPNQRQLDWYFQITLPAVWRQHQRSKVMAA